eukprot:Pgem_evm2s19015
MKTNIYDIIIDNILDNHIPSRKHNFSTDAQVTKLRNRIKQRLKDRPDLINDKHALNNLINKYVTLKNNPISRNNPMFGRRRSSTRAGPSSPIYTEQDFQNEQQDINNLLKDPNAKDRITPEARTKYQDYLNMINETVNQPEPETIKPNEYSNEEVQDNLQLFLTEGTPENNYYKQERQLIEQEKDKLEYREKEDRDSLEPDVYIDDIQSKLTVKRTNDNERPEI